MSDSEKGVSGNFESVGERSPPATAAAAPPPPAEASNAAAPAPSAAAEPQGDAGTQERFEAMLQELHKQGVSAPGTVAPASGTAAAPTVAAPSAENASPESAATAAPPANASPEAAAAAAANSQEANNSSTGNSNESSQENTWEREAKEYEAANATGSSEAAANANQSESAEAAPSGAAPSGAAPSGAAPSGAAPSGATPPENQVALMPGENFTLAPIPPTSLNEEASNQVSSNAVEASNEGAEASNEGAPPPQEAAPPQPVPAAAEAAAAPVPAPAPGRTEKQAEADAGQAFWLGQLKQRYDAEFANIPEKFRPKPKAYVARAVFYKPEGEREAYIQEWLQKDREAAEVRQGKRERRTIDVEPLPEEASLRSELISRGPENTSLSIELAKGAQAAISASPLKAQTFKAKERLTHLADRTFDRVVAQAKDPETRRIAKKMVGEFRRQVTILTREYQIQAKELERAARQAVKVEARKLAGRIEAPSSTRRASRNKSGSTRRRSK